MSDTGTTRQLARDIRRLIRGAADEARQEFEKNEQQPIQKGRGFSEQRPAGDAGIASPLTEDDAATRTLHPVHELTSTDGLIIFEVQPVATLDMTDANNNPVELQFSDPYAE